MVYSSNPAEVALSNTAFIASDGSLSSRVTTTAAARPAANPGIISYMPEDDQKAWKIRMDEIFKENA